MMRILTDIIGNMRHPDWQQILHSAQVESILLDQWTAQKSRFMATSDHGRQYAVALKRHTHIADGDILYYSPEHNHAVMLRLALNDVMVIDIASTSRNLCFEIGHAIGNQHWPAVIKDGKIYVPLTVDRKVMQSVMHSHNFDVTYAFEPGDEVIPYLLPHEVRVLFGGTSQTDHKQ
jgi:urease accessory protein